MSSHDPNATPRFVRLVNNALRSIALMDDLNSRDASRQKPVPLERAHCFSSVKKVANELTRSRT